MEVIYKYQITPERYPEVEMAKGAKILCVQTQQDLPYIWVQEERDNDLASRMFSVRKTGDADFAFERLGVYVGTFQLKDGAEVFHLYDMGEI